MAAPPFRVPLTVYQGASFAKTLTWKVGKPPQPVDLTGCSARMQVRPQVASPDVLLELTTGNGRILLGGPSGTVHLQLDPAETAALSFVAAVYDLEIVHPGGQVRRLASGQVKLNPEVTR